MEHKNGFTLIELLVVVLIIGILAAVALPQYEIAVAKAHVAKMLPFLRNLYEAKRQFFLANPDGDLWDFEALDISFPYTVSAVNPANASEGRYHSTITITGLPYGTATGLHSEVDSPGIYMGINKGKRCYLVLDVNKDKIYCYSTKVGTCGERVCRSLSNGYRETGHAGTDEKPVYKIMEF